jgi:hypothetical protein
MKKRVTRQMPGLSKRKAACRPANPAGKKVSPVARQLPARTKAGKFGEVLLLIATARQRAYHAINTELVGLG